MINPLPPEALRRLEGIVSDPETPATSAPGPMRLGCLAVMRGHLTAARLDEALRELESQRGPDSSPELLGQILVRRGWISREALDLLLREQAALRAPFPRSDRYELQHPLGEGALATVYQALDRTLGRLVAVKVLKVMPSLHETSRRRFRQEAQALARLSHPNVVAVHDFGDEGPSLFVVMELVPGKSLRETLSQGGGTLSDRVELLRNVALGVHHAHEHGIIHRDLKPENILVAPDGVPKVADFGLAHMAGSAGLTKTGAVQGTPLYMAPEQVDGRGDAIGPRTDVFALGAVLYEILTGRPPHPGETMSEIFASILSREPVPPRRVNPEVSQDLETIALTALSKDPERRYPTAQAFAEDLRRARAGEPLWARPPGLSYRVYKRVRRNRAAFALGAVAAVALGLSAFWTRSERDVAIDAIRDTARVSLEAALKFRRVGANDQMASFLPKLEEAYRQATERARERPEPDYLMGRMYRALQQDAKALEFQDRALAKDPDYGPALYERVVLRSSRYGGELSIARKSLRTLQGTDVTARAAREAADPTVEDAERARPHLSRSRDQLLQDCERLERRLQQGGMGESHALAARGILASNRDQLDDARRLLREAVDKDPLLEEAWSALMQAAWKKSDGDRTWDEVEALATEAIGHDRGYVLHWISRSGARHMRANSKMKRGADPSADLAGALEDLSQALRLDPESALAWWSRGDVHLLSGTYRMSRGLDPLAEFRAAEEDLAEAVRRGETGTAFRRRAIVSLRRGVYRSSRGEDPLPDFAAAERDLEEALRETKKNASVWNNLGEVRTERGLHLLKRSGDPGENFSAAEKDFTEALRYRRDLVSAWQNRGRLRLHQSDLRGADEDLSEALRLDDAQPDAWVARARTRLLLAAGAETGGDRAGAALDYAAAVKDFEEAIRRNPSLSSAVTEDRQRARQKLESLKRP